MKRYGNIAEIASNILELTRLSQITKNDKYEKVARRALDALQNLVGPKLPVPGLFPVWISTEDGTLRDEEDPEYSVGACADSFFEYLLKNWLMSGKTDTQCGEMFDEAIYAIKKHLLKINHEGLYYLPSGRLNELNFEMQHLSKYLAVFVEKIAFHLTHQFFC